MADATKPKIIVQRPRLAGWLGLFTSLSIIILAFFILLNAFASPDEQRVREAISSIQLEFAGIFDKAGRLFSVFDSSQTGLSPAASSTSMGEEMLFEMLASRAADFNQLQNFGREVGIGGEVGVVITPRGMVVTIGEELTFASGDDRLTPVGRRFLSRLAAILSSFRNEVIIEGHSDDSPLPAGSPWQTNWGLSQARAMSVLRYLNTRGIDLDRLSAAGAGQFRPVADNDTPENRERNRRVEIIIRHPRLDSEGASS